MEGVILLESAVKTISVKDHIQEQKLQAVSHLKQPKILARINSVQHGVYGKEYPKQCNLKFPKY
jgi:hypothetical protein